MFFGIIGILFKCETSGRWTLIVRPQQLSAGFCCGYRDSSLFITGIFIEWFIRNLSVSDRSQNHVLMGLLIKKRSARTPKTENNMYIFYMIRSCGHICRWLRFVDNKYLFNPVSRTQFSVVQRHQKRIVLFGQACHDERSTIMFILTCIRVMMWQGEIRFAWNSEKKSFSLH